MNEPFATELLTALNTVALERLDDGFFAAIGTLPDWFHELYPDAASMQNKMKLSARFPFLENFLIDAEDFWMGNGTGVVKSGLWSEINSSGNECHLEASAIHLRDKNILLIELLGFAYEEKQLLLQKARENSLSYHHYAKEVQKKEILLHCFVHDIAGQLTGLNCCFALIALENLTSKGKERLEVGMRQCTKQEILIQEILKAFSAEMESLEAFTLDSSQAPDAAICAKEVVDALMPTFYMNKIKLQLATNIDIEKDWKVVGEKSRLERIISNLVENALRHSPKNSTVVVALEEDGEFIVISVNDEGSGVPQELSKNLFQKFSQGRDKAGRSGLGLYFCRITVERWGGTIGYLPRAEGGARFWVRLPRPEGEGERGRGRNPLAND